MHPLFVFKQFGDLDRHALARQRPLHRRLEVLLNAVQARNSVEMRLSIVRRRIRADSASAIPALFEGRL